MENNYSVLMCVYINDNPEYLEKSISSIVKQTTKTNDFVIVKDGLVTQELQNVIDNFCDFDSSIRQIQLEKNMGLGLALNIGLSECKNELVARMDADDIALERRCELQLKEFSLDSILDIVGSSVYEFIGDENNIVSTKIMPISNEEIYKFARIRDPFNHPTVMYKKRKVLECGGYSDLRKNQDTDLWIKMLLNKCKCKNIKEPLLLFRFDEQTHNRRKNWMNTKLLIKIRYNSYKSGFITFFDFMKIFFTQIAVYIMPLGFQRWLYKTFLRTPYKSKN